MSNATSGAEIAHEVKKKLAGGRVVYYRCPGCGARLESPLAHAGGEDACDECHTRFVVPGVKQKAAAEVEDATEAARREQEKRQLAEAKEKKRLEAEEGKKAAAAAAAAKVASSPPAPVVQYATPIAAAPAPAHRPGVPICQHCGSEMMKKTVSSGNLVGLLLALIVFFFGIFLLFIPIVGWVFGPLLILVSLFMGGKRRKVWKCVACGVAVERQDVRSGKTTLIAAALIVGLVVLGAALSRSRSPSASASSPVTPAIRPRIIPPRDARSTAPATTAPALVRLPEVNPRLKQLGVDPALQEGRKKFIQKMIDSGVFEEVDEIPSHPVVYVKPAFFLGDFKSKEKIISVVFGYCLVQDPELFRVRIMDAMNHHDVGSYTESGLDLR